MTIINIMGIVMIIVASIIIYYDHKARTLMEEQHDKNNHK